MTVHVLVRVFFLFGVLAASLKIYPFLGEHGERTQPKAASKQVTVSVLFSHGVSLS